MDHPVSARSASATGTRTRVRSHHLLPDRHAWIDLGFTVVLSAIALSALGTSFTGSAYLVVGLLGVIVSVVCYFFVAVVNWLTNWQR